MPSLRNHVADDFFSSFPASLAVKGFDLYGKLQVAMGRGLGEFLAPGGELEMEGRYSADPAASLVFEPRALVVAEDGEAGTIRVRLRDPVEEGAEIVVFVSLHADDEKWAKSVFPRGE